MTADDVRAVYDEPPGTKIPRFPLFARECVGVLLGEIDRLNAREAELMALVAQQSAVITEAESTIGGMLLRLKESR